MKRYKQFEPIVISEFETSTWHHPVHQHNHYELIYIKNGSGKHVINSQAVNYSSGTVFLLGPSDEHVFEIEQKTRFVYLKFTDVFMHRDTMGSEASLRHLEYLIKSRETHQSGFSFTADDKLVVDRVFALLIALKQDMLKNEALMWMQVLALAHLLQRNMPEIKSLPHRTKDMQALFCYLHKHIYEPEKLKAEDLAKHFTLSKDYIGPYFKKQTGITLREYINTYRNSLINKRLESGQYKLKQIAAEFGLTDESHVSKLMKRKYS